MISSRNYHTAFYGLPFLNAVNFLAAITLLTRSDAERNEEVKFRIVSGLLVLILIGPIVYVVSNFMNPHHWDCACQECRRVWIPTILRREFPLLENFFTFANYLVFGVSFIEFAVHDNGGLMTIGAYFFVCFAVLAVLMIELFLRVIVSTDWKKEFARKKCTVCSCSDASALDVALMSQTLSMAQQ